MPAMLKTLDRESITSNISLTVVTSFNCGKQTTQDAIILGHYLGQHGIPFDCEKKNENFVRVHHLMTSQNTGSMNNIQYYKP